MSEITVGCDPEAFVVEGENIISVTGMIEGTKESPFPVEGGFIQEDNVLAEFNTEPHTEFQEFSDNIDTVIQQLLTKVPGLSFQASHHFEKEYLKSLGPDVLRFGCDPDYNAWTGKINTPPSPYTTMRTAAGHLHIGYDNPKRGTSNKIIQLCDVFAGLPSVVMQPECNRRQMYGNAGACRYKPYGVEYRVLSNFWVAYPELRKWAWDAMHLAVDSLEDYDYIIDHAGNVQDIINSNDVTTAKEVCDNMEISYVA